MLQNRRQYQRLAPSSPLRVSLSESKNGPLLDLCEGGLAFDGPAPECRDQVISLTFDLPEGNGHIEVIGEIAWTSDSGHRTGVRFVDLADTSRQQLKAWILARVGAEEPAEPVFIGPVRDARVNHFSLSSDALPLGGTYRFATNAKALMLTVLWASVLIILALAFSYDWHWVWTALHIPAFSTFFLDLRVITSGLFTLQHGGDPFASNPADPMHRMMNYPRIWLYLFSLLGINNRNIFIVGIILALVYLTCISILILRSKANLEALVLLFAGLSLAPLLTIERGNTDLFVFSLVFLGCMATSRYLKLSAFLVAALLKVYPVVALGVDAFRRPMKERMMAISLGGLVVATFILQWRDLISMRRATPVSSYLSYGVLSLKLQADHYMAGQRIPASYQIPLSLAVVLGSWLAAVLAMRIAWLKPLEFDKDVLDSKSGEMFSIFGAIYVCSYAIGSNWDYRLIFLLPTLPLVFELGRGPRHAWWSFLYIMSVVVAENSLGLGRDTGRMLGDAATFILFIMIVALLTCIAIQSFAGTHQRTPCT
jgi:hypothetical protein